MKRGTGSAIRQAFFVSGLVALIVGCDAERTNVSPDLPVAAPVDASDSRIAASDVIKTMFDPETADRVDIFSYANFDEVRVTHIDFDLNVDFSARTLAGVAELTLEVADPSATELILDTNDLSITSVEVKSNETFAPAPYLLGEDDALLGAKLEIEIPSTARVVRIVYETSPQAAGLQWLAPEQTAAKQTPFVYSQAQPIHARSMAPLQDTPAVRITYTAKLTILGDEAPQVMALMGAAQDPDGVRDGVYEFEMPQPIPSYLLALAVGDVGFEAISDHIGIYAEDYLLADAAVEFEDTPQMEQVAEALYGPYLWGRYDMIVLPPSFPFGGMENPRLSFLTPTLVAGDKSLTNVVAHELAHSWSGNLVTNATWRDAWLNEGFTTYVENRIMEALYGPERALMERSLELESLKADIEAAARPELTALKLPTDLTHPDEAFSQVAYVKGMFFLKFLEERFGRAAFDSFLRSYFDEFAFKAIVTEDFLHFLDGSLRQSAPDAVSEAELAEWIFGFGLPVTIENPQSDRFAAVALQQARWLDGEVTAAGVITDDWSTHEWLHFINTLPDGLSSERLADIDEAFSLSDARNAEIAFAWYMKAIPSGYAPIYEPLEGFLNKVGRGKFIYQLYAALAETDRRDWVYKIYMDARPGYHPIAQARIDSIFIEAE